MSQKSGNTFQGLKWMFLIFVFFSCKKLFKNTFFSVFPTRNPILQTRRAKFTILQPIFASVYCKKKHHIYHSREQSHFTKCIMDFYFFLKFSSCFLFFGQIPHTWQTLLFKRSNVIDILGTRNVVFWKNIIMFFDFLFSFEVEIWIMFEK